MYVTLIVGRTSSGKDRLAKVLIQNQNWNFIKSYSTRQPRTPGEDTHTFISKEEADVFNPDEIVTDTVINNIKYFCTKEQLSKCDGYIVNPNALQKLFDKCPTTFFQIVYIKAKEDSMRREAAIKRAQNAGSKEATELEIRTFEKRNAVENEEFSDFEAKLAANEVYGKNYDAIVVENDYNDETMHQIAASIEIQRRYHKNMRPIVDSLIRKKMITTNEAEDAAVIWDKNDPDIKEEIPIQTLVARLSYDNTGLRKMLGDTTINYLSLLNGQINPNVIPLCTLIPDETKQPNQNLFKSWLKDTTNQMAAEIIKTKTEHIKIAETILEYEGEDTDDLLEHVQKQIWSEWEPLYNQISDLLEKEIRRIIRSVVTPI